MLTVGHIHYSLLLLFVYQVPVFHAQVAFYFAEENYGFVNESENSFVTLVVEKSGNLDADVTVIIQLENSTSDFLTDSWPVSFSRDDLTNNKSVDIFINDDDIPEKDELFSFNLLLTTSSANAVITEPRVTHVTILANDDANGVIGFDKVGPVIKEEMPHQNATVALALRRRRGLFDDVTVTYSVSASGTESVDDISPLLGTVTLNNGESYKEFELLILNDEIPENNEEFFVTLVASSGGSKIDQTSNNATIVISENDSPLRFAQTVYRTDEEEAMLQIVVYRGLDRSGLRRVGPDQGAVLVEYDVIPGSANPNSDYYVQASGVLFFRDQEHRKNVEIYIKDDNDPELSENFTVQLRSNIDGDAVLADPSTCTVVIETNDNARGALAIDFSNAEDGVGGRHFLVNEDEPNSFVNISVVRLGGSFSTVSVQWIVQLNVTRDSDDVFNVVTPTSGTLVFSPGQKRSNITLSILENQTPEEAKLLIFKLFSDTLQGGAILEAPFEAKIIIPDSDDVYGVFSIDENRSFIEVDEEQRKLITTVTRSGGLIGDVNVKYSAFYLPPGVDDVKNALPGILIQTEGILSFEQDEGSKAISIDIKTDSFLQTGSQLMVVLESVELKNRKLLYAPSDTPKILVASVSISITEEYANGEIGFVNGSVINVDEPIDQPLTLSLEIQKKGLSGAAVVQLSYRDETGLQRGADYRKGPDVVTFEIGQKVQRIEIEILPDQLPELEETLLVRLDSVTPSNQKLNGEKSETRIIIRENDDPGGVFSFSNHSNLNYIIQEDGTETINIVVRRSEGVLARRMVRYDVIPNGSRKFYGVPQVLIFPPGKRSSTISLVPRDDRIPELETNYTLVLQPHGNPLSVLASPTTAHVTILANDHPHGLLRFRDDVNTPSNQVIGESKAESNHSASYIVHRDMGTYGNVSVQWKILPDDTNDVTPNAGILWFAENETEQLIRIHSSPDQLPESLEEFTIILHNATGGADIVENTNATLVIQPNDKAIYFVGTPEVRAQEGTSVTLTIRRDGSGADTAQISLRTSVAYSNVSSINQHQATDVVDFQSIVNDVIVFEPGVLERDVTIDILDDELPEADESFYVELFDAEDDYVAFGNDRVEIIILQNDAANGIFSFVDTNPVELEEGTPHSFLVTRKEGSFGDVEIKWKTVRNRNFTYADAMEDIIMNEENLDSEFISDEGLLNFEEGVTSLNITLTALSDNVPEYDEDFMLLLSNSTGGASLNTNFSMVLIPFTVLTNDYPYGLLSFRSITSPVIIAEDSDEDNDVTIKMQRLMGSDGNIKALWEMQPSNSTLPTRCKDLLLAGILRDDAEITEGRDNVNTYAVRITQDASVFYSSSEVLEARDSFSLSFWIKIENVASNDEEIPLIAKYTLDHTILSSISATINHDVVENLNYSYRSDSGNLETLTWSDLGNTSNNSWNHLLFTFEDHLVNFYYNGFFVATKEAPNSSDSFGDNFIVGSNQNETNQAFSYFLQDFRLYNVTMTSSQAKELHEMAAHTDVTPVSGYLSFEPDEINHNISLRATNDSMTEDNDDFILSIIDSTGGSQIDEGNKTLQITVLKSDYANGLFGFSKPCNPSIIEEEQTTTCYISRSRGLTGSVMVEWKFNSFSNQSDFVQDYGSLQFLPSEKEKSFNVTSIKDGIPELNEEHVITLEQAIPLDGVLSSSSYSGAAINSNLNSQTIVIAENEKPNGVFQFTIEKSANTSDISAIPEKNIPPILHVKEEDGHVTLVVERAAGWYGHVTCEWRTRDATAVSHQLPKDFEAAAGTLSFEDAQRYAEFSVELLDDEESELEKFFFVELSAPTGGASLNNASTVKVIIDPSDDAFGVFFFNETMIEVEEPVAGTKPVLLQVTRQGGNLGNATVYWRIRNNSSDDVTPLDGEIFFDEGVTSKSITVNVLADVLPEFNEVLHVDLYSVSKGSIGSASTCELTMLANDDPRGVLTFDPSSALAYEKDREVTATIHRSGGLAGAIRVFYATMDTYPNSTASEGIAISGQDFNPVTGSVLFDENVTDVNITIPVYDDETPEADEVFFVQLLSAHLETDDIETPNSPRIGSSSAALEEITIVENDSPNGILELSGSSVRVEEDVNSNSSSGAFLYVLRKLGSFGDVTVSFNVIAGTARGEEDYNVVSNQITLLDGETTKGVPIHIIDDFTPETEEEFTVELLRNSVTGGAAVGTEDRCDVTIEESDDPYGLFGISADVDQVEEPSSGSGTPITFTVTRRAGRRGLVGLSWVVEVTPAPSAAPGGDGNASQSLNNNDVDIKSGSIYFVTNQESNDFVIKILPDDMPEDSELVQVKLSKILAGHKGRVDPLYNEVQILIPANDRPYGDVSLNSSAIMTYEYDNDDDIASALVKRSGGAYGLLRVIYSTSEIDLVSEMLENQQNILENYLPSKIVDSIDERAFFEPVDISSSQDPRLTCAEACLRQRICQAFLYQPVSYECKWTNLDSVSRRYITFAPDDVTLSSSYFVGRFSFYEKNQTRTNLMYNSQARSDIDFRPLSGASVLLYPGQTSAFINISILPDNIPEQKEYFQINLLNLEMVDFIPDEANRPEIKAPSTARITIEENDHPYGLLVLSGQGERINGSLVVKIQERPKLSLELIVERQGGSVGSVTVDWSVVGGSALRKNDFNGDDATLKFSHGETSKIISLSMIDDAIPEPDETIEIQLHNPTGGAVLSPESDRATVIILANDVVGGVVGFAPDSKSLIAQEGDVVSLRLIRSEPALGRCHVTWHGEGLNGHDVMEGLNVTNGIVMFEDGQTSALIFVRILTDNAPETKERYKIVMDDIETTGISLTGSAILNVQSYEAEISIQDSDDPHGIFQIAPDSQRINVKEDQELLEIYVTRQFGSIGRVYVYFDVIPGTLSTVNPDITVAEPGVDFTFTEEDPRIVFEDGVTSAPIVMNMTNDDIPELVEIFHLNITRAVLIGPNGDDVMPLLPPKIDDDNSLSQVAIDANDGTKGEVSFNISSAQIYVTEGSVLQLSVYRDKGAYGEVSVFVYPQNKEAEQDVDYIAQSQTLIFADSQRSQIYEIEIVDDVTPEGEESFAVLLGNPSAGLDLGNVTMATVTIASNDDAHGRISFNNQPLIFIDEPENTNVNNSVATLVVKRNPPSGVFGEVTVRFIVEEIASNGEAVRDQRIDDVTPTEGYVTIEDGVSETTLEIAATKDDRPELDKKYRVTLFEPGQGATLDDNRTFCEIIVQENDAPYGLFQVVPSGIKNGSRIIRVNENSDSLISVDVVRSRGALGFVSVQLETVPGTAVSLPTSDQLPPYLAPFQVLPRSSGVWFHSFRFMETNHLLYLTNELVSPFTTSVGSRGTLTSLTPGIHSTLFKWDGIYTPLQTLETDGATCATTFVVDDVMFLFVANSGSTDRREVSSRLYTFTEEGLRVMQDIPTKGASYVVYFQTNNRHYLVIANSMDNNQISSIDSIVLRFRASTNMFEELQSLPTRGAVGLTVFPHKKYLYLAIANSYDSEIGIEASVSSIIYKWDSETASFVQPLPVDVSHAIDVQHYLLDGRSFLVFTLDSRRTMINKQAEETVRIFQVFGSNDDGGITLRSHQLLNVSGATKTQLLRIPRHVLGSNPTIQEQYLQNNTFLLMMVSSHFKSHIFIFNYQTLLFEPFLAGMSSSYKEAHIVSDSFHSAVVVAAAKSDASSGPLTSSNDDVIDFSLLYSRLQTSAIYDLLNFHKSNVSVQLRTGGTVQGDFVPTRKFLSFAPGETSRTLVINLLDDNLPEDEEIFKIALFNTGDKRPVIDDVTSALNVIVEANDDAFGVIGFDEDSTEKVIEETKLDNVFTLNLIREKSSFGKVAVNWLAEGSLNDVLPTAGQVIFEEGQTRIPIQMMVLADDQPEVEETVEIKLETSTVVGRMSSIQPTLNESRSFALIRIPPNDSPHGLIRWDPSSLRVVIKEAEEDIDSSKLVTLELLREQGTMGDLEIHFKTAIADNLPADSQATPGKDFVPRDSSLIMRENSTRAAISISIIPDDLPENIESFYVIIDDVTLIGESQLGGKPGIAQDGGNIAEVSMDENDDARGFIQFNVTRNSEGTVDAYEMPGINNSVKLHLVRSVGLFRTVGVEWIAQSATASNGDFFPRSGSVQFPNHKASGNIEIFIADDNEVEFLESFTVQLVGTSGGAKLGGDLIVTVNILPNDSPSGMFGFLQASQRLQESSSPTDPLGIVEFTVRRFQGSDDEVTLLWEIEESARNDLSPMSGRLLFPPGIRSRSIVLRSLPDQELEGEEIYSLTLLTATGGAEISPVARETKVIIEADRGAAGTVSLQEKSLFMGEPENGFDGRVMVGLERGPSAFGRVQVLWQILPADTTAFSSFTGEAVFEDGQNETKILVEALDDTVPERAKNFVLRLLSTTGGAEISSSGSSCLIKIVASDNPHGVFTMSQPIYDIQEEAGDETMTSLTEFTSYVTVTVLRSRGTMGKVSVRLITNSGSARSNLDYYAVDNVLVFEDGEASKELDIEIINDNSPEGPEDFFVNMTHVRLLSHSGNDYGPKPPFNLSTDTPPVFGDPTWSLVRIEKSDGAEGIVEFGVDSGELRVQEEAGEINIPLVRRSGTYGKITVVVNSITQTATRNVDFLLPSNGARVEFEDGQEIAHMSITLIDDSLIENEEMFTLIITSVSNQGKIGEKNSLKVIILKSEYPNGVIRFVGDRQMTIENPASEEVLRFNVERYGGNQSPVSVNWKIIRTPTFIFPTTSESSLASDIMSPLSGIFLFGNNQGGLREIIVRILPTAFDQEVEEHFAIVLDDADPAEISAERGNVTITVLKKGDPNGIVRFGRSTDDSAPSTPQIVEEPETGSFPLVFPVSRTLGSSGPINITWSVTPENPPSKATGDDLVKKNGFVLLRDSQIDADLIVSVKADNDPELDEVFLLTLAAVDGGAEIDRNRSISKFVIRANDDPHGVFAVEPNNQQIVITGHVTRLLRVNVTRPRGSFGSVAVEFAIKFDRPTEGISYLTTNTGSLLFSDGVTSLSDDIIIPSSVFLAVGDNFTVEITNVNFIGENPLIGPKISTEYSSAKVIVTDETGNAQIGFESTVAQVQDVENNICDLSLTRMGLFGDVTVQWTVGYGPQVPPIGLTIGRVQPSSDVINMAAGIKQHNFSVKLFPFSDPASVFALHLTRVYSPIGGGARMLEGHQLVEIDPSGVVQFASSSYDLEVTQNIRRVNLTVERRYGTRHAIDVMFRVVPTLSVPGTDYLVPDTTTIQFGDREKTANINIALPLTESKRRRRFNVELTAATQPQNLYEGESPRILIGRHISHVTILEPGDAHGYFSFEDVAVRTKESGNDGSDVLFAMVTIQRTVGSVGHASVIATTISGNDVMNGVEVNGMDAISRRRILAKIRSDKTSKAIGNVDYETRSINVSFPEGKQFVSVPVVILDDDVSESDEAFFVYLHSPQGGAEIDPAAGLAKILIEANDNPNGVIAFSQPTYSISETFGTASVVILQRSHAFGNVTVKWRTLDRGQDTSSMTSLDDELVETSGSSFCLAHELTCQIGLQVKEDNEAEFARSFLLEIYDVSEGAEIDLSHKFANVTIEESDHPWGLFQFAPSSRLPVVSKDSSSVGLTVERIGGTSTAASVRLRTRQIRRVVSMAGISFYPAVSGVDFVGLDVELSFQKGQRESFLSMGLRPDSQSANPLPQLYQVILERPSGASEVNEDYNVANITIFEDNNVRRVWGVYEALQQELNEEVIQKVLVDLHQIADENIGENQIKIFHESLNKVLSEGRRRRLNEHTINQLYELFCRLLDPYRTDAVRGYSDFIQSFDQFALCMTTDSACVTDDVISFSMTSCKQAVIQSSKWYPELINGFTFTGKSRDYFKIPYDLLDVSIYGSASSNPQCFQIYFLELSSSIWFEIEGEKNPMSQKVLSVGVDGTLTNSLSTPVRYRVYTNDARVSPQGAECVIWNHASSRWLSSAQSLCKVVDDSSNFVECECSHMSVYAARGPTDNLAGYNGATYAACIITLFACLLAPLCHFMCSHRFRFATKLIMQMMIACAATQLFFVICAMASEILSSDACSAMALLLHCFWLAQFTWMLVLSIHLVQVLTFNKESTNRTFLVFFLFGWGFPITVVLAYVIFMYGFGTTSIYDVYGDVHDNKQMCAIMNPYGAIFSALIPACLCVLVVMTVMLHLYQKQGEWKTFDDIFFGRFNSKEIQLLCWFFFLLSFTWLNGGLHLAFGYLWMLSLFIAFNFLTGFYVLIVYDIFRSPLLNKSSTMYDGGLDKTGSPTIQQEYQTATFGGVPSISGSIINNSTQSLVKMNDGWQQSENQILAESIIGLTEDSTKEESADFDDLISALNMENGEHELSTELALPEELEAGSRRRRDPSIQADQDKEDTFNGQQTSLGLADTHL